MQNPFLGLADYVSNLRRLGWTDADLVGGGSDALIDALAVARRRRAGALPGKAGSVLFMKNLNGQGPLTRFKPHDK